MPVCVANDFIRLVIQLAKLSSRQTKTKTHNNKLQLQVK